MESFKSLAAVLGVLFLACFSVVQAQECGNDLANVQVCAAMVLPGSGAPNAECCAALQSTNKDCLCNALRAATSLPSLCNLPAIDCGTDLDVWSILRSGCMFLSDQQNFHDFWYYTNIYLPTGLPAFRLYFYVYWKITYTNLYKIPKNIMAKPKRLG